MTRPWTVVGSLSLAIMLSACGEPRGSIETIEPLPRSVVLETPGAVPGTEDVQQPSRRGEGPESVLEFGLFGPVVPALGNDTYEVDCQFDDDPYETCL